MYLVPDPALIAERQRRRRDAAERYRLASQLRAHRSARRAERIARLRRDVGFGLMELGMRLAAPGRQPQLPSSRRGA